MFSKQKLLSDIYDAGKCIILPCNAGTMSVNMKGNLKGNGTV